MASHVGPQIVQFTFSSVAGFSVSGGGIFVLPTSFLYKKSASVPYTPFREEETNTQN